MALKDAAHPEEAAPGSAEPAARGQAPRPSRRTHRPESSADRFLGWRITPLTRRRLNAFRRNRRGFWSLWIFLALFIVTLFAEFIANDRPILVRYADAWYFPVFTDYPETTFGGEFPTAADYRDSAVAKLVSEKGWMMWPPIPFSYSTINYNLPSPAPSPPSGVNWLGTDDQGRDVLA